MALLRYQVSGATSSDDSCLLLHGFMGSGDDWSRTVEELSKDRKCIAVDLPGHGKSLGLPMEAYQVDAICRSLCEILDAEKVCRAHVLGYSMGGRVAMNFVCTFASRVSSLVIESSTAGLEDAASRTLRSKLDEERAAAIEADYEQFLESWYEQPMFHALAEKSDMVERAKAARRQNNPSELAKALRALSSGVLENLWPKLPDCRPSALFIAGGRDEAYMEIAHRMASLCRRGRVAIVPAAGHNVHLEEPALFNRLVHEFLDSVVSQESALDELD